MSDSHDIDVIVESLFEQALRIAKETFQLQTLNSDTDSKTVHQHPVIKSKNIVKKNIFPEYISYLRGLDKSMFEILSGKYITSYSKSTQKGWKNIRTIEHAINEKKIDFLDWNDVFTNPGSISAACYAVAVYKGVIPIGVTSENKSKNVFSNKLRLDIESQGLENNLVLIDDKKKRKFKGVTCPILCISNVNCIDEDTSDHHVDKKVRHM